MGDEDFIGIYARNDSLEALRTAYEVYEHLRSMNVVARVDVSIRPYLSTLFGGKYETFDIRFTIPRKIVVIGGDGTLLRLYNIVGEKGNPIVHPVKAGRRGYLFELDQVSGIRRLRDFIEDKYWVEELLRIKVTTYHGSEENMVAHCLALNEAAILAPGSKTMILSIHIDDGPVYESLEGDGVIVATPTGSTAYSYSAGGPILHHELDAMVITPINPVFCAKPIVVPASKKVKVVVSRTRRSASLIIDGQVCTRLRTGDGIVAEKSKVPARIARYGKPRRPLSL